MMWIAFFVMLGMYIGLTFLEKEDDEWSVFFKGLRILLTATLIVMLILSLLYDGHNEYFSSGVGLVFGGVLYLLDIFISKKMKGDKRKGA